MIDKIRRLLNKSASQTNSVLANKNPELRETFKSISIYGRIAYGIRCVEEALEQFGESKEDWKIVTDQLWSFQTSESIDEPWWYELTEYLPSSILELTTFQEANDWEYINEELFARLYSLYTSAEQIDQIGTIMHFIHEICSTELYTHTRYPAINSLKVVLKLIDYIQSLELAPPSILPFLKYKMNNGCWGVPQPDISPSTTF